MQTRLRHRILERSGIASQRLPEREPLTGCGEASGSPLPAGDAVYLRTCLFNDAMKFFQPNLRLTRELEFDIWREANLVESYGTSKEGLGSFGSSTLEKSTSTLRALSEYHGSRARFLQDSFLDLLRSGYEHSSSTEMLAYGLRKEGVNRVDLVSLDEGSDSYAL